MKQISSPWHIPVGNALLLFGVALCPVQQNLSWEQVKSRFESTNPTLKTDDEAYAQKITAYLRPNPQIFAPMRDTITYSYQRGSASVIDFLSAQSDYWTVQQAYLQLIGPHWTTAAQLDLAVGREVNP